MCADHSSIFASDTMQVYDWWMACASPTCGQRLHQPAVKNEECCLSSLSPNKVRYRGGGEEADARPRNYVSSMDEQIRNQQPFFFISFQRIKCRMSTRRLFMSAPSLFVGEGTCFTSIDAIHEHSPAINGGNVLHNYNIADG